MCVCVCGADGCMCVCVCVVLVVQMGVCVCACVCCFGGADGCIPLTMLVDICPCSRLLIFVCLPLFDTLPL